MPKCQVKDGLTHQNVNLLVLLFSYYFFGCIGSPIVNTNQGSGKYNVGSKNINFQGWGDN